MVYTKYYTIYDDTTTSRQSRSREPTTSSTQSRHQVEQNQQQQQHYYYEQISNTNQPKQQIYYQPRSASSDSSSSYSPPQHQPVRYTSQLNLHTRGGPNYNPNPNPSPSNLVRRSNSSSNLGTNYHNRTSNISRKLDYFDSKYGGSSRNMFNLRSEPIMEETTYPIYAVDEKHQAKETSAANQASSSSYRYYDVEIPIERANGTYHFDGAPTRRSCNYQQQNQSTSTNNLIYSSSHPENHSQQPQSLVKVDVEISTTPKSSRKKKCKSYELIFNSEYTRTAAGNGMATTNGNQNFHTEHFNCFNCNQTLTGSRYILKEEHPYCIKCYETLFANACKECNKKIGTDSKDLSYKDQHWHEKCFFCHVCKIPLVDKPFGSKNETLYCAECYNQAFASRCDKCAQIFKPGMKKMEYKGQQFHENCFLCFTCASPIGTKSFIPKDNKIFCVTCYEQAYATKCTKCAKVISSGGVSYKNLPYHRECFTCTNCQQSLAGQRFTSRDDHPYCSECFGKLFAKKCFSCHKPITVNPDIAGVNPNPETGVMIASDGIGGTKYISFEDRHWHNECFICNQCNTSLVGRGFLTDAMDILCPECGRN